MDNYEKLKKEFKLKKKITTEELSQKQIVELKREYERKNTGKDMMDIEKYEQMKQDYI